MGSEMQPGVMKAQKREIQISQWSTKFGLFRKKK
jgi:hypothetical protein